MATASKRSLTLAPLPAPKSREGLESAFKILGEDVCELTGLETMLAAEVARVTARFSEKRDELKKRIAKNADQISKYATKTRASLAPEGEKTIALENGTLLFYFGPSAVVCEDEAEVITYLEKHGPADALRVKTELDREYVDTHKEELDLPGVTHEQTEFLQIIAAGQKKGPVRKIRTVVTE